MQNTKILGRKRRALLVFLFNWEYNSTETLLSILKIQNRYLLIGSKVIICDGSISMHLLVLFQKYNKKYI
jgi:hypothetical protein